MEEKLDLILKKLTQHDDLLHQLIKNVGANNAKLNETNAKLDETNAKLGETNARLDKLELKVEENTKSIEAIKESMVTKNDLKYFDQKISEHEREILKIKLG